MGGDFALEADFPTSKFFLLGPLVNGNFEGCDCRSCSSVGKQVAGVGELGTAMGAFELFAGGVLGAAAVPLQVCPIPSQWSLEFCSVIIVTSCFSLEFFFPSSKSINFWSLAD